MSAGEEVIDYRGFRNWLKEQEQSDNTIKSYCANLKVFESFGGDFTKDNIVNFKWEMLKKRKPKTVNHYIVAVKRYCKYKGIFLDVKPVKIQKQSYIQNVMTIEQLDKLLSGLEKDGKERLALYITVLAKTGARISEALQLKKSDFDKEFVQLYTKGKVRTIYLPGSLRHRVKEYLEHTNYESEMLFINRYGKTISKEGFNQSLKAACRKYGIPIEVAHAHSLRHLFAIEFIKRNNNISLLADVLGHSGVNTTMIYTRMSQEEQIKSINETVDW